MLKTVRLSSIAFGALLSVGALASGVAPASAQGASCPVSHNELDLALETVVNSLGGNGGLGNHMWASVVTRDGTVCAVARSGDLGDQWPGSRVISAQKANTANAFSLPSGAGSDTADEGTDIALSSGNLYGTVLEQGSLFGLQFSNPVDPQVAYRENRRISARTPTR